MRQHNVEKMSKLQSRRYNSSVDTAYVGDVLDTTGVQVSWGLATMSLLQQLSQATIMRCPCQ